MLWIWGDAIEKNLSRLGISRQALPEERLVLERVCGKEALQKKLLRRLEGNHLSGMERNRLVRLCRRHSRALFTSRSLTLLWAPLLTSCQRLQAWSHEVAWEVVGGVQMVRGSNGVPFCPASDGGPQSKFDALFDTREAFDGLRYSFLMALYADLMSLGSILRTSALPVVEQEYMEVIWEEYVCPAAMFTLQVGPGSDFAESVWQSWRDAVCSEDQQYYLSVEELMLVCELARKDVVIFRQDHASQSCVYAGSVCGFTACPPVQVKLSCAGNSRGRGHFERLAFTTDCEFATPACSGLNQHSVGSREVSCSQAGMSLRSGRAARSNLPQGVPTLCQDVGSAMQEPVRRRLRRKTTAGEGKPSLHQASGVSELAAGQGVERSDADGAPEEWRGYYKLGCGQLGETEHPCKALEEALRVLSQHLRSEPTLPAHLECLSQSMAHARATDCAVQLPCKHCAFSGCAWTGLDDDSLQAHLSAAHDDLLRPVAALLVSDVLDNAGAVWASYAAAVAEVNRRGAPVVCPSIDRRCLYEYAGAFQGENTVALICFSCARRFPWCRSLRGCNIDWIHPFQQVPGESSKFVFCGMSAAETAEIYGLDQFLRAYGQCDTADINLKERMDEFKDWRLELPFPSGCLSVVCCPEDKICDVGSCSPTMCCTQCRIPACRECMTGLRSDACCEFTMPAMALANDLMIYYAPAELYDRKVSVLEMICASPCITSMLCFSLEKKYRGQHRAFDEKVHMNRHRMGARGNATSFPLPLEDILRQFSQPSSPLSASNVVALPWTGPELANFVSVLLKTSAEGDTAESLGRFIHQAIVRRDVVVELIVNAHSRKHPAYRGLDLAAVRCKAQSLPLCGVPEEIMQLMPHDDRLEKIVVQKAATPSPGRGTVEDAAAHLAHAKPNGVVLEKSSYDEADVNAQRLEALRAFRESMQAESDDGDGEWDEKLNEEPESDEPMSAQVPDGGGSSHVIVTGNKMLDQFEPWYFGVAFAFVFKYCTGMPDWPEFMKKRRYRRHAQAPWVDFDMWVRIMGRRVEAQLARDWNFGFVSWNLLFRSTLNLSRSLFCHSSRDRHGVHEPISAESLGQGAIELCKSLWGKYTDLDGRVREVRGDITKLRFVPGLSWAAKQLLQNMEHVSRRVPGTQETRSLMRFQTQAMRIFYGTAIFCNFLS